MPPSPTVEDIDTFVSKFDDIVHTTPPAEPGDGWVQLLIERRFNPASFVNASQGLFYVNLFPPIPANLNFFNVRTLEYRAYFMPLDVVRADVALSVDFFHGGQSTFVRADNKIAFTFTHSVWNDTNLYFKPQTEGCPFTGHIPCKEPQCSSTFNLSPYGQWVVQVNPGVFTDALAGSDGAGDAVSRAV